MLQSWKMRPREAGWTAQGQCGVRAVSSEGMSQAGLSLALGVCESLKLIV